MGNYSVGNKVKNWRKGASRGGNYLEFITEMWDYTCDPAAINNLDFKSLGFYLWSPIDMLFYSVSYHWIIFSHKLFMPKLSDGVWATEKYILIHNITYAYSESSQCRNFFPSHFDSQLKADIYQQWLNFVTCDLWLLTY